MHNEDKKLIFTVTSLIILTVAVSVITNFRSWESVKGLAYPTTTSSEINSTKRNKLLVQAYESEHGINKEDYKFKDSNQVSKNIRYKIGFDGSFQNASTDFPIESNENLKNIILIPDRSNFVGWSGCDAIQKSTDACLVSVVDNQTRKIEAHYSQPKPDATMQLFSISNNNSIGGSLNENWTNVKPELAYKAAYIDVSGPIPSNVNELDPKLELALGGNPLGGSIPKELGELSNTDYIGLQKAELEGEIPKELGNLNPKYFLAYNNELEGEIPKELSNMSSAERFELHNNNLEDAVPKELTNLSNLNPSELRLYNNNLESTESGLMKEAPWEGINFHNNNFSKGEILNSLGEAASNSGDYIDFCGNAPVVHATYSADGKNCSLNVPDEVNKAADAWSEIYVEVTLRQSSPYYPGHCDKGCNVGVTTKEECDEDGENCEEIEVCTYDSICEPAESVNTYAPLNYPGQYCIKIEESVDKCEDLDPVPDQVDHAAEYGGCDYWKHGECEPNCVLKSSCSGPSKPSCSSDGSFNCQKEGYKSGRDNNTTEGDDYESSC